MLHFCSHFDSFYLTRALAMYNSLKRTQTAFTLYVFPFDSRSLEILTELKLEHVVIVPLEQFENDQLLSIKGGRDKREYIWTCTPWIMTYVLNTFKVDHCIYLDADLYFFNDPKVLFDELAGQSTLITEHRYTREYDKSEGSGIYCVQFVVFRSDKNGLEALNWWKDRCLEWCYARKEDGKFGDQKYLDDWTTRFKGVHVLEHLGGGVAPWNVQQYNVTTRDRVVCVGNATTTMNLIFFHFHDVKFYADDNVDLGIYKLSNDVREIIYDPYFKEITEVESMLNKKFQFKRQTQTYFYKNAILTPIHRLVRMFLGVYTIINISNLRDGKTN